MDITDFTEDSRFQQMLNRINNECPNKVFSDVIDDAGHQYVDLVMEGGGMLGIALVGYTAILEQAGIRFLGLGGTSAGSINALLIAAVAEPATAKAEILLNELANKDLSTLIDGDADAKDLVDAFIQNAGPVKLGWKAIQVIDNLNEDWGLNPGAEFTQWMELILSNKGIRTAEDLQQRMNSLPAGLRLRDGSQVFTSAEQVGIKLAIVAADVATETKVELPKMAKLYWQQPEQVNPAFFARASMSIPFFFHPLRLKDLPQGPDIEQAWKTLAGYRAEVEDGLPDEAILLDGGIMSNFPIDLFHDVSCEPIAPTFGVKLQLDQRKQHIKGPKSLFLSMFNAARHTLDYDFIRRNPDYRQLVSWIPAKDFNWLDFNMSEQQKVDLFIEGAQCATEFLCDRFDWQAYKAFRAQRVSAHLN